MKYSDVIFDLLDQWRHLPSYQLERRADIFFAPYIYDLIEYKYQSAPTVLIPEFPIRIGTIHQDMPTNKSYKADYFVIVGDSKLCVLIELKTDDSSRRPEQDDYLAAAQKVKLSALLDGVIAIYQATESKHKYNTLVEALSTGGLLKREGKNILNVLQKDLEIDVLYIQPNPEIEDGNSISFDQFAGLVEKHQDDLSQRFSKSLREWASTPPGHKVGDA